MVLQEHAHPFGPEEKFYGAVRQLNQWILEAGSKAVIYMTWAKKDEEFNQERMTLAHEQIADELGMLLAPVGKYWWDYMRSYPDIEMYYKDGQHASPDGSRFAAKYIWNAIETDLCRAGSTAGTGSGIVKNS